MSVYESEPHPTLRQGDIILAPTAILLPPAPGSETAHSPARLGDPVRGLLWAGDPYPAPATDVEAQWSPVLVLSHDCELEKDFNERVRELVDAGMDEEMAVQVASDDSTLDPFAVVSPLLSYGAFLEHRHAGIRAGQRIGFLPVDALPGDGGDYVVDLFRPCTLSVELLPQAAKVASLAQESVYELRYKISEAYASRDLAVLVELEAVVGHRITGVEALPRSKKKTSLVLHLGDAPALHLEIRAPREDLASEGPAAGTFLGGRMEAPQQSLTGPSRPRTRSP